MKRPTHMAKLLIPFLQLHLLLTACAPQTPTLPSPTSSPGQAHEADAKPVPAQGSLESSLTFLQNAIQEILAQVTAGQSEPEAAAREINRQVEQVQMQTKDTRLLASSVDSAFSKQLTTPNDTRALLEVLERLQTLSAHLQPQQGPDSLSSGNPCPDSPGSEELLQADVVVLYVNGILTNRAGFCKSQAQLAGNISRLLGPQAKTTGFFNYSPQGDLESACRKDYTDLTTVTLDVSLFGQSLLQTRLQAKAIGEHYCPAQAAGVGLSDDILEAAQQRLQLSGLNFLGEARQVNELSDQLASLLKANKRVIIVGFSQGNLFVMQALRKLLSLARENSAKLREEQITQSIGVIWVASPVELENAMEETELNSPQPCGFGKAFPTCFSRHVSIGLDPVARLRYIKIDDIQQQLLKGLEHLLNSVKDTFIGLFLGQPPDILARLLKPSPEYEKTAAAEWLESPVPENTVNLVHHDFDKVYICDQGCDYQNGKPWAKIRDSLQRFAQELRKPQP